MARCLAVVDDALDAGIPVRIVKKRDRQSASAPGGDDAVHRRAPTVVGPSLQQVTGVHDQPATDRFDVDPVAVERLHLETGHASVHNTVSVP